MKVIVTFLMILGVHMHVLFIIKVKIIMLIKGSHKSPHLC